jgi:hypothetical protein
VDGIAACAGQDVIEVRNEKLNLMGGQRHGAEDGGEIWDMRGF